MMLLSQTADSSMEKRRVITSKFRVGVANLFEKFKVTIQVEASETRKTKMVKGKIVLGVECILNLVFGSITS